MRSIDDNLAIYTRRPSRHKLDHHSKLVWCVPRRKKYHKYRILIPSKFAILVPGRAYHDKSLDHVLPTRINRMPKRCLVCPSTGLSRYRCRLTSHSIPMHSQDLNTCNRSACNGCMWNQWEDPEDPLLRVARVGSECGGPLRCGQKANNNFSGRRRGNRPAILPADQ